MLSSSPSSLPSDGVELIDSSSFRQVIGSLQYLQSTRPDIAFVVNRLAQKMNRPTEEDWIALKRVLRYPKGSIDLGLFLAKSLGLPLVAYSDADGAGDKTDRCSMSAYLIYLGPCLVSWKSFKQKTVARSSTEAEYGALASAAAEIAWVQSLLSELGISHSTPPVLYCDNVGATYFSSNPVFHSRMKHLVIDYHFVCQCVQSSLL